MVSSVQGSTPTSARGGGQTDARADDTTFPYAHDHSMQNTLQRPPSSNRAVVAATPPSLAWGPILLVVTIKLAISAAVSAAYGWHRDELYYADAGRNLDLGFVDFPSVTPALAALARVLFADSLVGLRLVASLAGAGVILVTAALCRDLGGGRRAQVLAAVAVCPLLLGSNAMFQTVSFDQLTWAVVLWATTRLLQEPTERRWLALGAAVALACQTKYTVAILLASLLVGFVTTRAGRSAIRPRAVVVSTLLVALVAVPNLWWQIRHGWVSVDFFTGRDDTVRSDNPPLRVVIELVVITGPITLPLALRGIGHLWRDTRLRPLAVACALVTPLCVVLGGKSYYVAPIAVGCLAAGAAALDATGRPWTRWQRALPLLVVTGLVLSSPMIVPVLPRSLAASTGVAVARDDWANEVGWPELTSDVAYAWRSLPADERQDTVVVAGNYGVAGALERFGPSRGLDAPVISGHLTWAYWPLPAEARGDRRALAVGFGSRRAPRWCDQPTQVGRIRGVADIETEEQGMTIWSCRLATPIQDLRPQLERIG